MKSPEIARRDLHAEPPGPHDQHAGHKGHEGHDKHAGHSVTMFRERFWLSLALSVPTLVWSPSLQDWLGFSAPSFPLSEYVPPLFGTAVFFTRTPEETAERDRRLLHQMPQFHSAVQPRQAPRAGRPCRER